MAIEIKNEFLKSYRPYCETAILSWKGGQDYIRQFLVQHPRESDRHFSYRLGYSFYLNFVEKIVNVLCGFIVRGISRSFGKIPEDTYRPYVELVDFYRPINTLIRDKIAEFLLMGDAFALCDSRPEKKRAFVHSFHYLHIVDFLLRDGDLESITLSLEADKTLQITATEYITRDVEGKEIERKKNGIGVSPVVAVSKKLDDPNAYFRDAIWTNKALFNHYNNANQQLYDTGFSILALPTGDQNVEVESLKFVNFNPQFPEALPRYIAPPTDHLDFYVKYIDGIVDKMLGSLNIYRSEERNTSGLSKSYDYSMMTSFLGELSLRIQAFETDLWKTLSLFDPKLKADEIRVQYPRDFDITSLQDDLDNALTLLSLQVSSTFDKALKKKIVAKQIDDEGLRKKINDEIEKQKPPEPMVVPENSLQTKSNQNQKGGKKP